jgi:hypothetical protein
MGRRGHRKHFRPALLDRHFLAALLVLATQGGRVRGGMTRRVWHFRAERASQRALLDAIGEGAWDAPREAALPGVGDYIFLHADRPLAVGRVVGEEGRRFAMRWAPLPATTDLRGVPRVEGLRLARAFAWEQRQFAEHLLGPP